jgi:hypothetical protein
MLSINLTTLKQGSGILKHPIQNSKDEDLYFYNSLVLTGDLAFPQTHCKKTPPYIPHMYQRNTTWDGYEDLPLQNRSNDQNNKLLKIAKTYSNQRLYKRILSSNYRLWRVMLRNTIYWWLHTSTNTDSKHYPKMYNRRPYSTRKRNNTTENKTTKPINNDTSDIQRNIHPWMPDQNNKPTTATPSI